MVYAPADGLVQEGTYLWSYQVHQVWAEPIPSKIVLTPSTDYAIAGGEYRPWSLRCSTSSATRCRLLRSASRAPLLEGASPTTPSDALPVITDENGNAAVAWNQAVGDWGVEKVVAYLDYNIDGTMTPVSSPPTRP